MLNNTEYNNTIICVLPKNVEVPTTNTYARYCKKYAPKRTRECHVVKVNTARLEWQVHDSDVLAYGRCEYLIVQKSSSCDLLVSADDRGFCLCNIPTIEDAIAWAEYYDVSSVDYCTCDVSMIEWAILKLACVG